MRTTLAFTLLLATACSSSGGQQPDGTPGAAEEEVRRVERRWLDAYEQNDAEAMNLIVADDFMITFPNGAIQTKPQLMAMIRAPRSDSNPTPRFYTEDVRSRAYGDTVILTGTVVTESQREGKTVTEKARYTDTYVRRDGRWQVVASHLSNIQEPKKPRS